MSNKDKMLNLVLSDDKLQSFYEYDVSRYTTIEDALLSDVPIVVAIAKIIQGVSLNPEKTGFKEIYNEIVHYLNESIV